MELNTFLERGDLHESPSTAIQEKLRAEQEAERMAWVLQREEAEARRKIIEARGIAEFQKIVQEGISEQLLRWKGIEGTYLAATSHFGVLLPFP